MNAPLPQRPTLARTQSVPLWSELVELNARLRLACEAIGCAPSDVQIDDLCPFESNRLRRAAEQDVREWLAR